MEFIGIWLIKFRGRRQEPLGFRANELVGIFLCELLQCRTDAGVSLYGSEQVDRTGAHSGIAVV